MSLDSLSSPEVLTPDTHSTGSSRSQFRSGSQLQSQFHYSQSSFSSLSTSTSRNSLGSSSGSSGIDWSSFDEQKRKAEERWRKRRLIKARGEQSQSQSVDSMDESSSLPGHMTEPRVNELSSQRYMDITTSSPMESLPIASNAEGSSDMSVDATTYNNHQGENQELSSLAIVHSTPRISNGANVDVPAISTPIQYESQHSLPQPSPQFFDIAPLSTTSSVSTSFVVATTSTVVEFDDDLDDDAFLRQLMARAEQAQQEGQKATTNAEPATPNPEPQNSSPETMDPVSRSDVIIPEPSEKHEKKRQRAIKFLESIFLNFLTQVKDSIEELNDREINSSDRKVKRGKRKIEDDEDEQRSSQEGTNQESRREERVVGVEMRLKNRQNGGECVVSFPDDPLRCSREPALHKMTQQLRVAELLYEAVLTRCVTTLRDIYYKDVQLFKKQEVVDKLVDQMVATAGLKRQDFMVCATSKGLVASSALKIHLRTGDQLSLSATNTSLIPPIERIERVEATDPIEWVLIVEKDAVFQVLLSLGLLAHEGLGPGVLITGKGYPDLATIQVCHLIHKTFPTAEFHALVDADPHGIHIMQVYAHGSEATRHSIDHHGLSLGDKLNWMGVKASQWTQLGVRYDDLLPLTDQDHTKAMAMLRKPGLAQVYRRELQHMLHMQRKAEIQIVDNLLSYTVSRLSTTSL